MALTAGTRLGSYEITGQLGVGGMGEVYRATDKNLGRQVAIKVLPEAFAQDADRLARFEREAKTLASLNHPNIAQIYGLEKTDGIRALVMELVEGPTLADRIAQGPISVDEALPIAKQIAEALEAAHEQGIIHRDLKPANIKLRPDGTVKVLDFGLAKALEPTHAIGVDATASPTITSPALMTGVGVLLGTAAYMSPEQARGKPVDKRSDIWAFGCVLYEMLTGKRVFDGDDISDTLAAVLRAEPDWTLLPSDTPASIRPLLRRCLAKDRRARLDSATAARLEIEESLTGGQPAVNALRSDRAHRWTRLTLASLTLLLGGALAGVAAWYLKPAPSAPAQRFSIVLPEDQNFTRTRSQVASISPDGSMLVYVANNQLHLRRLDEFAAQTIQGPEDIGTPFFSPDGRWIGFFSFGDTSIKRIAVTGGAELTLCAACANTLAYGVSWEGDTIVFARGAQEIVAIPQTGGTPEVWVKAGPEERVSSPQLLPGGNRLMFSTARSGAGWEKADIVVLSRETGERTVVIRGGTGARYVNTGHLVYAVGPTLYAVPFDVRDLRTTGEPVPTAEGVMRPQAADYGPSNFDVSDTGTLIFATGDSATGQTELAVADVNGKVMPVMNLPPGLYIAPRVSPDGRSVAMELVDDGSISIFEMSGKSQLRRLTLEGVNAQPVWSPDGKRIAYRSNRAGTIGVFVQNADGTGGAEQITNTRTGQDYPFAWSTDGEYIIFVRENRLWTVALQGDRKVEPLTDGKATTQLNAALSPDGRWMAYASNETRPGGLRIYLQQFPSGAKYQLSRELANAPVWSRDARQLFYYQSNNRRLVSIRVQTEPSFSVSEPVPVSTEVVQPEGATRQDRGASWRRTAVPEARAVRYGRAAAAAAGQRGAELVRGAEAPRAGPVRN